MTKTGLYLDNAASMRPGEGIPERFSQLLKEYFVNGEAGSMEAFQGRKALEEANEKMLFSLLGPSHNGTALYTNSGTESINAASFLLEEAFLSGTHSGCILTTKAEHPALLMALTRLAQRTASTLRYLSLTPDGGVDLEELSRRLKEEEKVSLLAIHHVHNETGRIQDLPLLRKLLNEKAPSILLLADTIQSAGKIPLPWQEAGIDFALLSGQKVGSPMGGALLAQKRWTKKLSAIRQTYHLTGRCPLPGGILMAELFTSFCTKLPEKTKYLTELKDLLHKLLQEKTPLFLPTIPREKSSPWITHFLTSPYEGAILTRMLGEKNITLSAGSACSSETHTPSPVLLAMGIPEKKAFGSLRISFSGEETQENISFLADSLKECVEKY